MKTILTIVGITIAIVLLLFVVSKKDESMQSESQATQTDTSQQNKTTPASSEERFEVTEGTYDVQSDQSTVLWSGKKPLIDGYINSGSLGLSSGTIVVADTDATGEFTIDMDTLSVTETAKKPGQENALEGHLKSDRWFDVATYPTASFAIKEVSPRQDSVSTFVYDVRGDLTMKGQTHELIFPATIFLDQNGMLHAQASFEFDRTKWGITSGSGSFFDNLADNVIDDMVALSFSLVAQKQ